MFTPTEPADHLQEEDDLPEGVRGDSSALTCAAPAACPEQEGRKRHVDCDDWGHHIDEGRGDDPDPHQRRRVRLEVAQKRGAVLSQPPQAAPRWEERSLSAKRVNQFTQSRSYAGPPEL